MEGTFLPQLAIGRGILYNRVAGMGRAASTFHTPQMRRRCGDASMSGGKQDRRTRYTRTALRESLMELMLQKGINKITIKELCQRADVNRSTFYAHYRDQYDLLRQVEDEILDEINANLAYFDMNNSDGTFRILENIFRYIQDNSSFCRLLLSERGDVTFQKRVMDLCQGRYMEQWLSSPRDIDPETAEYLYLYLVNGSIGVVQNWLRTEMEKTPSEMAELLLRFINQGMSAFA